MNKNNIKAFEDGAINVRFILTDEAVEHLNNAGYGDMLKTYNQALNEDNVVDVFCEMAITFCTILFMACTLCYIYTPISMKIITI